MSGIVLEMLLWFGLIAFNKERVKTLSFWEQKFKIVSMILFDLISSSVKLIQRSFIVGEWLRRLYFL